MGSVSYTHLDVYKRQSQGRADTLRRTLKRILQVTKQPRATLAAATNHHAIHAGLLNHAYRILGGENIAITQDRHIRNQLTQLRNRIPVSLTRIMLSRSTTCLLYTSRCV